MVKSLGFAPAVSNGLTAYLAELVVAAKHRNHGVARKLLAETFHRSGPSSERLFSGRGHQADRRMSFTLDPSQPAAERSRLTHGIAVGNGAIHLCHSIFKPGGDR